MRFNQRCLPQRQTVLDFPLHQFGTSLGQFFPKPDLIEPHQLHELPGQILAVLDVFKGDIEAEARNVVRQQHAVTVIDQTAGWFQDDRAGEIGLGEIAIIRTLADLEMPEAKSHQPDHQQQPDLQDGQTPLQLAQLIP